jgi:tetratricopeptide (TPR) repeat protein
LAAGGIIHRDIKSDNIMVDEKGQVMQRIELAKKSDEKLWEASLRHLYAYLLLKTGHYETSLAEFNKMRRIAAGERNLTLQQCAVYGRGVVRLEMKLPGKAQQAADELKALIKNSLNKKMMRFYYHLMGRIELTRNNYSRAIEYFNQAIPLISFSTPAYFSLPVRRAIFIDSLAEAYYRAGNREKARQAYEQIAAMTYSRFGCDDVFARSFYHLGKIYREKGLKRKASENYSKFIELWKDCDPQFQPLVKNAGKWVRVKEGIGK